MDKKRCARCKEVKGIEFFGYDKSEEDGFNTYCKQCNHEKVKKWRENNKEKEDIRRKQWAIDNSQYYRDKQKESYYKYTNAVRIYARSAVSHAVRNGKLPVVSSLVCESCHNKNAQSYHHHKGYKKEHWLDVIPVCNKCHKELDKH